MEPEEFHYRDELLRTLRTIGSHLENIYICLCDVAEALEKANRK